MLYAWQTLAAAINIQCITHGKMAHNNNTPLSRLLTEVARKTSETCFFVEKVGGSSAPSPLVFDTLVTGDLATGFGNRRPDNSSVQLWSTSM